MLESTRVLLSGIIDYAGLFPPAKLDMASAVRNYAGYLAGPHAWMLGRFIVPVARLEEFEREAEGLFPQPVVPQAPLGATRDAPSPWSISVLVGDDLDADIDAVFAFNQRHAPPETDPGALDEAAARGEPDDDAPSGLGGGAVIDTLEIKLTNTGTGPMGGGREIDRAMNTVPEQLDAYFEIPTAQDPRGLIAAIAGTGARAKVRTGGVTPDAFPAPEHLARFISACAAAEVPFKATAGLHHPVRGEFDLTYEPNCPRGLMYGFLNVFLAAALLRTREGTEQDAVAMLSERDPTSIKFAEPGVAWRGKRLAIDRLALVRESFATSFGSCSFDEPVADLRALGLLPPGPLPPLPPPPPPPNAA
ncbi:MAG: hypothetical protein ACKVZJ_05245 [Phycisphaerales bacterium]